MTTYTIHSHGASLSVRSRGAELCSYIDAAGKERIWQADPAVWPGHSPVLFPIVGAPKNNTVRFASTEYPIRKHGFMMMREFALIEQTEDCLHFAADSDASTLTMYPYAFTLHILHHLVPGGFRTEFVIENRDTRPMPYCIGGHPGFICPMEEGACFEDYILRFSNEESGQIAVCPDGELIRGHEILPMRSNREVPLVHTYFDEKDALIFTDLASREVDLVHAVSGKGIHFTFADFDVLGVWTRPGMTADYLCLEPWIGLNAYDNETGDFEDKPHVRTVAPGENHSVSYTATVLD